MSIIISVAIPEGVVIAADSRQTYVNARQNSRVGSDFGSKIFQLTPRIAVATFGWAFLQPQSANTLMSIGAIAEEFRSAVDPQTSVSDAANRLTQYFQQVYDYDINSLRWNPTPQGDLATGFHVMGYNQDSTIGEVYFCQIPPGTAVLLRNTNNPGCNWNGQIDVVSRLVLGFDPRFSLLPFVQQIMANNPQNQQAIQTQLNGLQYIINWHTMTLQDAVDFVSLMVNSTIKMQRFSDGVFMNPGDIPGCGGEIDVAVVTHREGFRWIQKKEIKISE